MLKLKYVIPAVLLGATNASAHATLEIREAPVGSYYKAILAVPHGCHGKSTIKVRMQIPEGVISVKPQPKPGWKLEKVKGPYAKSYKLHGMTLNEGVKEISWSGGPLADDESDEFIARVYLAGDLQPNTTLYFPVVQECVEGAVQRWIEIPSDGKTAADYEAPAAGLKLLPKK